MKKLVYFFLFSLFVIPAYGQSNSFEEQLYLEEFGFAPGIPYNQEQSSILSTWTSVADAPNAYGRVTHGVIGNFLYVFCSQGTPTMAVAYNITTQQWIPSTTPTATGFNIGFAVANGELYKLGTVFEKFTPAGDGTGTWTVLPAAPTQIRGAENSVVWDRGDYLYANGGTTTNYFQRYHITNQTWEAGLPLPPVANRRYAGMVFLNGFIYRIGGLGETNWDGTLCHKYDPATNSWSSIASLPEAVNFTKWSTTTDDNKIYLVSSGGGFSPYTISNKCFEYDPLADTWTEESIMPAVRGLAMGIFVPGVNKLFYGGGNDGSSGTAYQVNNWEGVGAYTPVELSSFNASVNDNSVQLNWTTASETNNAGFEVQRKAHSAEAWGSLEFVEGFGTTTEIQNYAFTDRNLNSGEYSYRLKQIDFDGTFSYSDEVNVIVGMPDVFSMGQNYPNPFNPSTKIDFNLPFESNLTIKIYDITGSEAAIITNEIKPAGYHTINFDAGSLTSGVYLYRIVAESNEGSQKYISTKKMIVLK